MVQYNTVSLPKDLHDEIRKLILENPMWNYRSVAEFSKEAIILRLKELRKELVTIQTTKKEINKKLKNVKKILRHQ